MSSWLGRVAGAEGALHEHRAEPAAVLVAHRHRKTFPPPPPSRNPSRAWSARDGGVGSRADHREHLAEARALWRGPDWDRLSMKARGAEVDPASRGTPGRR